MQVAMIGLGRMGMNMARRLLRGGHEVVAYNRTSAKTEEIISEGAVGAFTLPEVVEKLSVPRAVWLMLPAGPTVDEYIRNFKDLLSPGDIVVEGGNTYYKDDLERANYLGEKNIHFVDAGVSGGIWGLEVGYCLMIGGEREVFNHLEPLFKTLAPEEGYLYCGPVGAGHFVKMIHNGIEYGMMQAYAEGFDLLEASPYGEGLDYGDLAHLWNRGSVIRSWLLELAEAAFRKDGRLSEIRGYVEDSGEGRWMVREALERSVPMPVIALSLMQRFRSRREDTFADKVLAALRKEFGGHAVVMAGKEGRKG
ncbi:MAG: decarboxylating 6-phosphogluconate dehydrogenase [Deltaproteobacteria bacterium]|nr:decarboxylating 6-phosphogluconate dehydrogenase [Deltaproteobacteria bacterium]MBW2138818.1 decarboxylating 6-phosphogluconate dehydrogenase [Deltaproteobacteria bacterium]